MDGRRGRRPGRRPSASPSRGATTTSRSSRGSARAAARCRTATRSTFPTSTGSRCNADRIHSFNLGLRASLIPGVLDLLVGARYEYALGELHTRNPGPVTSGSVSQQQTAQGKRMPATEDSMFRLDAGVRYHFWKGWYATLSYAFEVFEKSELAQRPAQSVRARRQLAVARQRHQGLHRAHRRGDARIPVLDRAAAGGRRGPHRLVHEDPEPADVPGEEDFDDPDCDHQRRWPWVSPCRSPAPRGGQPPARREGEVSGHACSELPVLPRIGDAEEGTYKADDLNERGKWMIAEKDKRKAKDVDAGWLKEYPGGK